MTHVDYNRARFPHDLEAVHAVIDDGAQAYRGVIPADCWHEPYMSMGELKAEIAAGVVFTVCHEAGTMVAVMGIQDRVDVTLIRHAYVRRDYQRGGIGTGLLKHVRGLSDKPFLIGTWAAASWAIAFYCKHEFALVSSAQKGVLLGRYWDVSARQTATSVVLADRRWRGSRDE
jgi:GNAT superfamily N-acetyltransferase